MTVEENEKPDPSKSSADADNERRVELWCKHEDIAMHFNDLAMRLRLQALAGIGAAALIAGTIFTHQGQVDRAMLGWFLVGMALVWASIFLLDFLYYQRLLNGAVDAMKKFEPQVYGLTISADIQAKVGVLGSASRGIFYAIIFILLVGGGIVLLCSPIDNGKRSEPACIKMCQSPGS